MTNHKNTFREMSRRYAIISYVLKGLTNEFHDVTDIFKAVLYFKYNTQERKNDKTRNNANETNLLNDTIRVYILNALTEAMKSVGSGNGSIAINILTGIATFSTLLLKDDPIVLFATKYVERIADGMRKIKECQPYKDLTKKIISQLKKKDGITDF